MHRWVTKFVFFILLWAMIEALTGMGGDTAFVVTLILTYCWTHTLQLLGQAMQMIGPGPVRLILQGTLWLGLFWWFAPAWLGGLPFYINLVFFFLIALIGAHGRGLAAHEKKRAKPRDRSLLIVLAVIGGVALCAVAMTVWGSLWPLAAYGMLVLLPFGVGWQLSPLAAARAADARVGDPGAFEDAGLSRER